MDRLERRADVSSVVSYESKTTHAPGKKMEQAHNGAVHTSFVVRKPVFGDSDQVRHKPGSTIIEDD